MFKTIKENLKDPKKKAITQLVLYGIFFIFVFALISSNDSSTPIKEYIEEENSINSYEYIYKINNNNVITEVFGTIFNNEERFNYNNISYYKNNSIIYDSNNIEVLNPLNFDTNIYSYQNIEKLINSSEFIEKTTYKDNSEKITYNINASNYFNSINDITSCSIKDCSTINISFIVEKTDNINHVQINLYEFYGYLYNIDIYYSNINNIEKISTN